MKSRHESPDRKQGRSETSTDNTKSPASKAAQNDAPEQSPAADRPEAKETSLEQERESDSAEMSSAKYRQDGNKFYTSATLDLCAALREERLKKALQVSRDETEVINDGRPV